MNRVSTTPQQLGPRMSRDISPRRDAPIFCPPRRAASVPSLLAAQAATLPTTQESVVQSMPTEVVPEVAPIVVVPEASRPRRFVRYGMPSIATMLIIAGVLLTWLSLTNNIEVTRQLKVYAASAADSGEKSTSTNQTSSSSNNSNNSTGQSDLVLSTDPAKPRHITIAATGIDAPMVVVGLNKKNEIGTPANINYAAWYDGSSSLLDKQGTSIIVGHRGTDRYPGIFSTIDRLQADTEIKVTMGDGSIIRYKVVSHEVISSRTINMSQYISYRGNTNRILYLITCEGTYDESTHTYPDRVIVKAVGVS